MSLTTHVEAVMREVAARVIMPRYRALAADEIAEKTPGEIVTRADREAEAMLRDALLRLDTGARVVGEEAASADPALLDRVGEGMVWLVDPLDGTANFARGVGPFGVMVALVADGEPLASWMLDPVSGRLCHAESGGGAWIDGERATVRDSGRLRPVAALATQFMGEERRARTHRAAARHFALEPIPRCAAAHYPILVTGAHDLALFQRILPWDHAAGVLFLTEAGGHAAHWDGGDYRVGSDGVGILAAACERMWLAGASAIGGLLRAPAREAALAA
jgi:fructose-1,6-bisphosphatase/inositol monophosphatase family enzyme